MAVHVLDYVFQPAIAGAKEDVAALALAVALVNAEVIVLEVAVLIVQEHAVVDVVQHVPMSALECVLDHAWANVDKVA